jgi:hypothetical protein
VWEDDAFFADGTGLSDELDDPGLAPDTVDDYFARM